MRAPQVTEFYRSFLLDVFETYSKSDVTINQRRGHAQSMNFKELVFMCKEGALFDERLSLTALTTLFTQTNSSAAASGMEGDTSALSFAEFIYLLAQIANAKSPPTASHRASHTSRASCERAPLTLTDTALSCALRVPQVPAGDARRGALRVHVAVLLAAALRAEVPHHTQSQKAGRRPPDD